MSGLIPYLRHPQSDIGVEQLLQKYLLEAANDPVRHQPIGCYSLLPSYDLGNPTAGGVVQSAPGSHELQNVT
jgi:hypothetical protein